VHFHQPLFSLTDVVVKRSGSTIVENINWTVNPGDNWVLLGPNGIGKSTIVNIISSRMFPTSGGVQLLGQTLGKVDVFQLRPKIGVLGADIGSTFPNSETVLKIVALAQAGMTSGWGDGRDDQYLTPEVVQRAKEMLELFSVGQLEQRMWGVLSQGERKRVQMARTLMSDPELLLFDEPTAGLDLAGREQVINVLNKLAAANRKSGKSILLVNHNVEEIPPSFDNIAIMGRSVQNNLLSSGTILYSGKMSDTLNSANLSAAYGIDLQVIRTANLRYFASTSVILPTVTCNNHSSNQANSQVNSRTAHNGEVE
jgi:iron complex transport system ATP-binding protein